jgi:hypothetical protein
MRRQNKQLRPIHLAAYFLHPENYYVPIRSKQQLEMRELFKRHTSNYEAALKQFFDFQAQSGSFGKAGGLWDHTSKPGDESRGSPPPTVRSDCPGAFRPHRLQFG